MRPLVLDPGPLRRAARDLESSLGEVVNAAARVDAPQQGYPWQGLVDRGVTLLLDNAAELVRGCHRFVAAIEDSLRDFETLDVHVADAASRHR